MHEWNRSRSNACQQWTRNHAGAIHAGSNGIDPCRSDPCRDEWNRIHAGRDEWPTRPPGNTTSMREKDADACRLCLHWESWPKGCPSRHRMPASRGNWECWPLGRPQQALTKLISSP